ncbi:AMP-binding protein [Hyphomicrobium sp.]|uniref:phenylacetate--CoA ligase family protein n=1 Tax=Hyphomicrobium sp. TaxID=82 RepID=UPI000FAA917A|nr:AMP-binding protein [Hyphomicrobium sp.]RUP09154.1 MAG: phenylacetate--CoA ligase family protein [Hyphomicrobium sp.]
MRGFLAAAYDQVKLALAIRSLLPPRPEDLERRAKAKEARFRKLLQYAYENSPYYRKQFKGIDLETCAITDLPTLTKVAMMANLDDIFTDRDLRRADIETFMNDPANVGYYYKDKFAVCHTSGSQGQPAIIVQDKPAILTTFAAQFARGKKVSRRFLPHLQRLFNPARFSIITQKPGFYPSSTFFNYFPERARRFLKLQRLSVFDPPDVLVQKLNEFQPNFITGYTSALETITRELQAGRLKLRGDLEQMTNISEPLPEPIAQRVEKAFGVHITNVYSMAECMALTCGCQTTHGSHLNDELAFLEVVDARGKPVPNGTPGAKVLLTNLYNLAQPIIRYEVDDIVTISATPCECGSLLPLIQAVQGRSKDQFWVNVNGEIRDLPYYVFLLALHNETNLAEHQFLQTGVNRFVMRAAPLPGQTLSVEKLSRYIQQSVMSEGLANVIHIDVEIVDRILPEESGKVRRAKNIFGPPPATPSEPERSRTAEAG